MNLPENFEDLPIEEMRRWIADVIASLPEKEAKELAWMIKTEIERMNYINDMNRGGA